MDGHIRLHHVRFEGNTLNGTASLRTSSKCSALELIDVELKNNTCDGKCGIILSKENQLRDIKVSLTNQTAEGGGGHSIIFYARGNSSINAANITATNNSVEIFHMDKGNLTLQASNLSNNTLSPVAAEHSLSVCLHVVNSNVSITNCTFEQNEGAEGTIVFAEQSSNLTMQDSVINGTKATEGGGGHSIIFYARGNSIINAANITATNNEVEIFHMDKGNLTLQASNLSNNTLSPVAAEHSLSVCLHVVNSTVSITNCTFEQNEGAEGTIVFAEQSSNLTMQDSVINGAKATKGGGGAVVLSDMTNGTFDNCTFTEGHTDENGGFIAARDYSNMTIRHSEFKNASAKDGGCVYVFLSDDIRLEDVTFEECHSVVDGGALRLTNVTFADIKNVNMTSNSAGDDGGCMYAEFSNVSGTNWTAVNNAAGDHAGAFRIRLSSNVNVTDSNFTDSQADRGGAVSLELGSTAHFKRVKFNSSAAATDGGVFSVTESEMCLSNCTLQDGSAENGGFLYSRKNASITIVDSNLTGGRARHGGCLRSLDGNLTVQNSTFQECHSDEDGGAMHLANITVDISNSTFVENDAGDDGGAIYIEKTHFNGREMRAGNNEATGASTETHTKHSKVFRVHNHTRFENNSATNGGAIHLSSFDDVILDNQTLDEIFSVGNTCHEFGGAVSIVNSSLRIVRSEFRNGTAKLGAFVSARSNSSLILEDSNMTYGTANTNGGAIAVFESRFEGTNISIACCNASNGNGGALFFEFSDIITQQKGKLTNGSRICNNRAKHGGPLRSSFLRVKTDVFSRRTLCAKQRSFDTVFRC